MTEGHDCPRSGLSHAIISYTTLTQAAGVPEETHVPKQAEGHFTVDLSVLGKVDPGQVQAGIVEGATGDLGFLARIGEPRVLQQVLRVRAEGIIPDLDAVRDITSRLGLADVRQFSLTWEDCEGYLSRL